MRAPAANYICMRAVTLPWLGITYLSEALLRTRPRHRYHDHAETQVLWLLSGAMDLEMEGRVVQLSAGRACVIPARLPHAVGTHRSGRGDARLIDLRIAPEESNSLHQYLRALGDGPAFTTNASEVERGAQRFAQAMALDDAARRAPGVLSAVWQLLGTLSPDTGRTTTQPHAPFSGSMIPVTARDPRLDQADAYCRQRLSESISVDDIAAAVGLSRSQLTRLYQEGNTVGPAHRLRQLRCELARHLLATTSLSIKEIAVCCGFAQANHFGRVFQQVTGVKPTEFRAGSTGKE